jgi:hypothetical protein
LPGARRLDLPSAAVSVVGRAWPAAVILGVIAVQTKHQKRLGVQLAGPLASATLDTAKEVELCIRSTASLP